MSNVLNPLLSKVKLPGRVFSLPSKGLFYKPGEVLDASVRDGEIQVKPMSALTEIKIRSADLLMSGKILREVCAECAPEIINPEKLVTKDVDALFIFLVTSTYGSLKTVRTIHTGPNQCKDAKVHDAQVNLDQILIKPNNESLEHREMTYQVDLLNGQKVILKPVAFQDSIDIMVMRQDIARKEIDNLPISTHELERIVIADLLCVIEAVEDITDGKVTRVTDRGLIGQWCQALSKKQVDMIVEAANLSSQWGFDFHVPVQCKDCGEIYSHELELNPVNFFSG